MDSGEEFINGVDQGLRGIGAMVVPSDFGTMAEYRRAQRLAQAHKLAEDKKNYNAYLVSTKRHQTRPKSPFLSFRGLGAYQPSGMPYGPYRYGTKNYWQWYATVYLPRYYSQQQIIQQLQSNPLYGVFGMPYPYSQYTSPGFGPGYPGYSYPYGSANYSYQWYNYPYSSGYLDPYLQAQYTYGNAASGAQACAAQGGIWDWFQQACGVYGNTVVGATTGDAPNVVGMAKNAAITYLNSIGWLVWLLNEDGYSGGAPQDYNPRRMQITVQNGLVTGSTPG